MFDYSKLCGRIVERFGTRSAFAEKLGMTPSNLSGRLKGHVKFSSEDISKMVELLEIPDSEISTYFFTRKVQ